MKSFIEREKGFEAEFKRNQELAFRITARRNRLFGLWAAGRLAWKRENRLKPTRRAWSPQISKCPAMAM